MASYIGRRKFLAALGGTAVAWPLAARAQQPDRVRRIGVLHTPAADDPEGQVRNAAFLQGLKQFGWTDGGRAGFPQNSDARDSWRDLLEQHFPAKPYSN